MTDFSFGQHKLIQILFVITGLLICLHVINLITGEASIHFDRLFNLNKESNVPTWFSSMLWALSGVTALGCRRLAKTIRERRAWLVISLGLIAISIDEVAMIHENVLGLLGGKWVGNMLGIEIRDNPWPLLATPFLIVGMVWFLNELKVCFKDSNRAKLLVILGAFTVITGGWFVETMMYFNLHHWVRWQRYTQVLLEESLEMFGAIIVLSGLLIHRGDRELIR